MRFDVLLCICNGIREEETNRHIELGSDCGICLQSDKCAILLEKALVKEKDENKAKVSDQNTDKSNSNKEKLMDEKIITVDFNRVIEQNQDEETISEQFEKLRIKNRLNKKRLAEQRKEDNDRTKRSYDLNDGDK